MIIATPLDIPKIEPDDWELFWKIWHKHSDILVKTFQNVKNSPAKIGTINVWRGIDVYKKNKTNAAWQAPYYDIKNDLPIMYQQLEKLQIFFTLLARVRIMESLQDIVPHTDSNLNAWNTRAIFYCTDPSPQWYFTRPNTEIRDVKFLKLPNETNWFAYNDKHCWHGSKYNSKNPKLIIQLWGFLNGLTIIKNSIEKYRNYVISYD